MTGHVQILGIRGLPPAHGGFETFVGELAPFLVSRGWDVTVFCQEHRGGLPSPTTWQGVKLHQIPSAKGSWGSLYFDYESTRRASRMPGTGLVFGYNTAVFNLMLRVAKKPFAVNMDGIEWKRKKWGKAAKSWFFVNEMLAARSSTALIADHPEIERHLRTRARRADIAMIPYGASELDDGEQNRGALAAFGLDGKTYGTIIARPEPENSILEMVRAFSARRRGALLVVLGDYDRHVKYQRLVLDAASDEVVFPGAIYDKKIVQQLRVNSLFYMYGHTVGGTSPTLVEALASGCIPICLDTVYARWVTGEAGVFFTTEGDCDVLIQRLLDEAPDASNERRAWSLKRFRNEFTWEQVLLSYEGLLKELRND